MRKTVLVLLILAILPAVVSADVGFGGAMFYKSPILLGQNIDVGSMNVDQFSFGGDVRLKFDWFQAEALLLYSAGDISSLNLFMDVGVALDLAFIRLSIGAGPNFTNNFGTSFPIQAGLNAKIGADVMLGPISIGLSYIMAMNIDDYGIDIRTGSGLVGISCLFWM